MHTDIFKELILKWFKNIYYIYTIYIIYCVLTYTYR